MVVNEWQFMAVNHSKVRERDPTKLSEHPLGYVCNWIAFVWQTTNCSAGLCALYWKSFLSLSHILWHIIDTSSSKQTMPSVTIGLSKPYSSCCSCFSMPLKLLECWISILRHSDCWSVWLLVYATPIAGVLSFLFLRQSDCSNTSPRQSDCWSVVLSFLRHSYCSNASPRHSVCWSANPRHSVCWSASPRHSVWSSGGLLTEVEKQCQCTMTFNKKSLCE